MARDKVVVYTSPKDWKLKENGQLWERRIIDEELAWGHAVAFADLDQDGSSELIVGVRDDRGNEHRRGVRVYREIDAQSGQWNAAWLILERWLWRTLRQPTSTAMAEPISWRWVERPIMPRFIGIAASSLNNSSARTDTMRKKPRNSM